MVDYLKNNPIARRHCLLYEFLQHKSVNVSFYVFCETVGPEEDSWLQHWFDQFEQGKFDDKEQPVADMKDVLRNDNQALRACVMYEWLTTKNTELVKMMRGLCRGNGALSPFTEYMNFCKVIGDDVMGYREFDMWFYRFENGMFDLKFERDKDEKILELSDMPIDVMKNIGEYLNIFDRLALKKTSPTLQAFIEDQKLFHPTLQLSLDYKGCWIIFGEPTKTTSNYWQNEDEPTEYHYIQEKDDCVKLVKMKSKLTKDVFHWEQALTEFKQIINTPKLHLNCLMISINMQEHADLVLDTLEDALKSTHQLHVKKLTFKAFELEPLLKILPNLKPGYLTTIDIILSRANDNAMKKLAEMEQWKQAECLMIDASYYTGALYNLFCFRRFTIGFDSISAEDIRQIKEILFKSPGFEKCQISMADHLDTDTIRQEFGDFITERLNTYHYPIPNSTECFEVVLTEWRIVITRKKM